MTTDAATDALLSALRPQARVRAVCLTAMCNDLILPLLFPGFTFRITVTERTDDRQAADVAAGLSACLHGWHEERLALDFGIFDADGKYVTDGSHPAYAACGLASVALGFHYPIYMGPNQTKPDFDHTEFHPGVTMAQVQAADAAGKVLFS